MAPYRNAGQSSGFEPYDMNQRPTSHDAASTTTTQAHHNEGGRARGTRANAEEHYKDQLQALREKLRTMMQESPEDTDDPKLNDFKAEFHSMLDDIDEAMLYAMEHMGPEGDGARSKLQAAPGKVKEFLDRVAAYRLSLPPPSVCGFVRYEFNKLTLANVRAWVLARNFSILYVAFALLARAYMDDDWGSYLKGSWTCLSLSFTLFMNSRRA